jgi:farnesyl diphosphate synthase
MTDYTVPGGKLNRGLSVIDSLRLLKEGGLTEQEEFQACALGWCIEWVSSHHDFSHFCKTVFGDSAWFLSSKPESQSQTSQLTVSDRWLPA